MPRIFYQQSREQICTAHMCIVTRKNISIFSCPGRILSLKYKGTVRSAVIAMLRVGMGIKSITEDPRTNPFTFKKPLQRVNLGQSFVMEAVWDSK